jgi:hypothetical protein
MVYRLFTSGMYSDLTIVCGTKRYQVHRALLATRSAFFEGACRNSFLEAETGVIDLSEDDAEAVEHMVHCKLDNADTCRQAETNAASPRLLPHGLSEQTPIPSNLTTLFASHFAAIVTLYEAQPAKETESCARGRSAPSNHVCI